MPYLRDLSILSCGTLAAALSIACNGNGGGSTSDASATTELLPWFGSVMAAF